MPNTLVRRLSVAAMLGTLILAAGCSGGGSATPQAAGSHSAGATAKARLTVKIPLRKAVSASANRRQPKYVSIATAGLGVRAAAAGGAVNTAAWQLFDVAGTSPLCTTIGNVRTCVVQITAPAVAGTQDEFQIDATDTAPTATDTIPPGTNLSGGDVTQAVVPGAVNAINEALSPIIGTLATDKPSYSVWAPPGGTATLTVNVTASDPAGDVIFGNPPVFANPITFSDNLAPSPFTYQNPSASFLGLPPPADAPGPIPATIGYVAPAAVVAPATVTVSTIVPIYFQNDVSPTATFTINPLFIIVDGVTASAVAGLSLANSVPVTISEAGATQFTVTANNAGASGSIALPNVPATGVIPATNGVATFTVQGLTASTPPAPPPSINIVDASGTNAVITANVIP